MFKNLDFASVIEMEGTRASLDSMPQECSTRGRGDYRTPSVCVENVCAWQLVSKDKQTSYAVYARNNAVPNYKPEYLTFKGVEPEQVYCVEQLGIEVKGSTLMYAGIPVLIGAEDYKTITFDITMVDAM